MKSKNIKRISRFLLFTLVIASVIAVYYYIIHDIGFDVLSAGDSDAIRNHLKSYGPVGLFVIAIMEALQMIVIFIPAEFVQISAGLAYPIWLMVPACIAGICLGATVIYFFTAFLHIKLEYFENNTKKINRLIADINNGTSMTVIMLILFIMPLIPIGAICYFAASSKIKYPRYIAVCAVGVLPSVLISYAMGNIIYHFIGRGTVSFVAAVVVTVLLAFLLLYLLLDLVKAKYTTHRKYPKSNFICYHLLTPIMYVIMLLGGSVKYDIKALRNMKRPAIIISPHTSFVDFLYISFALYPRRITYVINQYYYTNPLFAFFLSGIRPITKKLFSADPATILSIYAAKRNGNTICMFPEGRLTTDGKSFPIAKGTAELIKKLDIDVYVITCDGAYLRNPKWAKRKRRGPVKVNAKKLLDRTELAQTETSVIERIISDAVLHDDEKFSLENEYESRNLAAGAENILYRCPSCTKEYGIHTESGKIECKFCGFSCSLDSHYMINGAPYKRISEWLEHEKAELSKQINKVTLKAETTTKKITGKKVHQIGEGVCTLDSEHFTYTSDNISFSVPTSQIEALPFSAGEEFELYYQNDLYMFYPKENRSQCVKWSQFIDILTEKRKEKVVCGGAENEREK